MTRAVPAQGGTSSCWRCSFVCCVAAGTWMAWPPAAVNRTNSCQSKPRLGVANSAASPPHPLPQVPGWPGHQRQSTDRAAARAPAATPPTAAGTWMAWPPAATRTAAPSATWSGRRRCWTSRARWASVSPYPVRWVQAQAVARPGRRSTWWCEVPARQGSTCCSFGPLVPAAQPTLPVLHPTPLIAHLLHMGRGLEQRALVSRGVVCRASQGSHIALLFWAHKPMNNPTHHWPSLNALPCPRPDSRAQAPSLAASTFATTCA